MSECIGVSHDGARPAIPQALRGYHETRSYFIEAMRAHSSALRNLEAVHRAVDDAERATRDAAWAYRRWCRRCQGLARADGVPFDRPAWPDVLDADGHTVLTVVDPRLLAAAVEKSR
jgi:hypothetical protein